MQQINQNNASILPQLTCTVSHNNAKLLCFNHQCQSSAFICRKQDCQCLPKYHQTCHFIYYDKFMNTIINKKTQMTPQMLKAVQAIDKIYQQAIEKLSNDRDDLQIWKDNYGLTQTQAQFLQSVKANALQKINGKVIAEIKQSLEKQQQQRIITQQWVSDFWKKERKNFHKVFAKLDNLLNLCRDTNPHLKKIKYKNNSIKSINGIVNQGIDSKILQQDQDVVKMLSFFQKPVKSLKLLYRASQNSFSSVGFHNKCDDIKNTVTIVQTQFGKIIGGFTPIPWSSPLNGKHIKDQTGQSFLFSISLNQKYPIVDKRAAVRHNQNNGPIFGSFAKGQQDLAIADNSDLSWSKFPSTYNNGNYKQDQSSIKQFCGQSSGKYFHLKEWQVFQVQWMDQNK